MWWLIIPTAVFIIILCIVLDGEYERQVKRSAKMPIEDSWLFENDGEPYREFEFETSDEKIIINETQKNKIKNGQGRP